MVFGRHAATEWSISKLLTFVLLGLLLVIVIWGYSTGAGRPLFERVGTAMDLTLISLNLKDAPRGGECFSQPLLEVNGGNALLDLIESDEAKRGEYRWSICTRGEVAGVFCNVSNGEDEYYLDKGAFYFKGASCGTGTIIGNLAEAQLHGELFHGFARVWDAGGLEWRRLVEAGTVGQLLRPEDFHDRYLVTDVFVLYSEPDGGNEARTLIWVSGHWALQDADGAVIWSGTDDEKALGDFYAYVTDGDNDRVYYSILKGQRARTIFADSLAMRRQAVASPRGIVEIAGDKGVWAIHETDELDHDTEFKDLKTWFAQFKRGQLVEFGGDYPGSIEDYFRGASIRAGGFDWSVVSYSLRGEAPEVEFVSGGSSVRYGLDFKPSLLQFGRAVKGCISPNRLVNTDHLYAVPFSLVRFEAGSWREVGEPQIYKLSSREYFDAVMHAARIHKFIGDRC